MDRAAATARRPAAGLVRAARSGDRQAVEQVLAAEAPHVYNVVGRALNGHADVDDVVQETLIQIVRCLPALQDPERFHAWALSIAHRQVLACLRSRRRATRRQRELTPDLPDPGSDFAARTVAELELSDQRREVAEAARWLEDDDRLLLALWWQEATGEIDRAELAAALGVRPALAAVRVKRVRERLDAARTVTRALAAGGCDDLAELTREWDGKPGTLWRKRLVRHTRDCPRCSARRHGLLAPERLLEGLLAVPMPAAFEATACHVAAGTPMAAAMAGAAGGTLAMKAVAVVASVAAVSGSVYAYPQRLEPVTAPFTTPGFGVTRADYFVAPTGSDDADGSIARPFATVSKAVSLIRPGQTIALRGGVYRPTRDIRIAVDGTADRRITLSNYRDERPVIDATRMPPKRWTVTHEGDYWTVQGLELTGSGSHAFVCVSCEGVVLNRISSHHNRLSGLTLRGPGTRDNLVLDSDFYDNHHPDVPGQSGIGIGVKFGSGTGNVLRGNRTFDNGDNGIDLGDFASPVTVEHNWSYRNGTDRWGTGGWHTGAHGFALGGGNPSPAAAHVVRENAAWDNGGSGFSADGNPGAIDLRHNTAWRNLGTGFSLTGSGVRLRDNVAADNPVPATVHPSSGTGGNSWNEPARPSAALFRSTDPATAVGTRQPDGSLPETAFLTVPGGRGAGMRPGG